MTGSRVKFLWVLGLFAFGVAAETPQPARAQYTIFDFFDQGPRRPLPRRYAPRYDVPPPDYYNSPDRYDDENRWRQRYEQRQRYRPRVRNEVSSESSKPVELPKDADAKTILVLGDQMGDGLAQGLREAFSADNKAKVQDDAKDGISLISKKGEAFTQYAKEKIAADNPAAIVVMIGVNDRRDMEENGKPVEFQSERWRTLYLERADALLQVLKEKHVPVYWVGLPSARNKILSGTLAYLNGLYQQKSYVKNAKYVDVWEGFVDEDGNYMIIGPDVNGNQRRLRMRDGVTLTAAGNRKLAFYVEKELRRDLVLNQSNVAAATGTISAATVEEMKKPASNNAYVGPVISLNPSQAADDASLLGDAAKEAASETTGSVPLITAAKPGRSDDFSWPLESRQLLPPLKGEAKTETKAKAKKN
jgi:hypothetical protein